MSVKSRVAILMGVAGSGKTTLGRFVADALEWRFIDADDFHTPDAKEKMANGIALEDSERLPWLDRLRAEIDGLTAPAVVACSGLRSSYRELLASPALNISWIWLEAPIPVLMDRVSARLGHFFSPSLLRSQIKIIEPPEDGFHLSTDRPMDVCVAEVLRILDACSHPSSALIANRHESRKACL